MYTAGTRSYLYIDFISSIVVGLNDDVIDCLWMARAVTFPISLNSTNIQHHSDDRSSPLAFLVQRILDREILSYKRSLINKTIHHEMVKEFIQATLNWFHFPKSQHPQQHMHSGHWVRALLTIDRTCESRNNRSGRATYDINILRYYYIGHNKNNIRYSCLHTKWEQQPSKCKRIII